MSSPATDNSHFELKVGLRMDNLPAGCVRVLDCFSGTGRIWNEVRRRCPDRQFHVTRIDQRPNMPGVYLRGDNRKYLAAMNLDAFNVIDLDAYGVPFEQMELLFSRPITVPKSVFVTYIRTGIGQLPHGMLEALGYSRSMISKCPTLFCRHEREKLFGYLANRGVTEVTCASVDRKHYLHFSLLPQLCSEAVPEAIDELLGRQNAHRRSYNGVWWDQRRRAVFERDRYLCAECGVTCVPKSQDPALRPHCDHIVPKPQGSDEMDNLRTICQRCHSRKTAGGF